MRKKSQNFVQIVQTSDPWPKFKILTVLGAVFPHFCPDKREIWHGGADPRAKFHVYLRENVGIQPPKLSKFRILARNLYLRGDWFAIFLRNS